MSDRAQRQHTGFSTLLEFGGVCERNVLLEFYRIAGQRRGGNCVVTHLRAFIWYAYGQIRGVAARTPFIFDTPASRLLEFGLLETPEPNYWTTSRRCAA